jgi:hypothetical protein
MNRPFRGKALLERRRFPQNFDYVAASVMGVGVRGEDSYLKG